MEAVGYIRVSTDKQDYEAQRAAINEACAKEGLRVKDIITDTVSSREDDRKIYEVVSSMKENEVLVCYEPSRLARSISQVFEIVQNIKREEAGLWIIQPEIRIGVGSKTSEMQANMILFALSTASEIERELISERTKNALKQRKESGMKLGRPEGSKLEEREAEIKKYIELGINKSDIAKLLGVSRSTLYEYLNKRTVKNGY